MSEHGVRWTRSDGSTFDRGGYNQEGAEAVVLVCSSVRFSPRALAVLVRDSSEWRQIETQREAKP